MEHFAMEASDDAGRTWFLVDTGNQSFWCIGQAKERAVKLRRWERVVNLEVDAVLLTVREDGSTISSYNPAT